MSLWWMSQHMRRALLCRVSSSGVSLCWMSSSWVPYLQGESKIWLLVLPSNVELNKKGLQGKNTLAYQSDYELLLTKWKKFYIIDPIGLCCPPRLQTRLWSVHCHRLHPDPIRYFSLWVSQFCQMACTTFSFLWPPIEFQITNLSNLSFKS
jgi:hypothetical protein